MNRKHILKSTSLLPLESQNPFGKVFTCSTPPKTFNNEKLLEVRKPFLEKVSGRRRHYDTLKNENLSEFCGKWKDDRDADDIIAEIYANREQNFRSEKFSL